MVASGNRGETVVATGMPKRLGLRPNGRILGRTSGPLTPSFGIGYGGSIRSYTPTQNLCPHLKTAQIYIFGIVVRSVGDGWAASCPSLKKYGAFTLGVSREEVLNEMHRVVQQIVEALAREKNPYPRISSGDYLSSSVIFLSLGALTVGCIRNGPF